MERGTNLAAADVNGKSDPYVVAELVRASKEKGKWKNIKTSSKTKTSTVQETLNPVWDFQVYSLYVIICHPLTHCLLTFTCKEKLKRHGHDIKESNLPVMTKI